MDAIWRRIGEFTTVPLPADEGMRFHDAAQLRAVLSRAGYVDVETEASPFDVVLPDVDSWLDWLRSMEFVEYLERLSPASLEKLRTSARADLTDSTERSAIRFPMDALLTRARKPARRSTPGLG